MTSMKKTAVTVAKAPAPKLFCLVGLPGSGKTFFAEKFSKEYQIPFVNLNKWRFLGNAQPSFSREEDARLTEIGFDVLEQFFKTHKSILLEGNLSSRVDRQRYAQLARRHGYRPVIIWVQNVDTESKRRAVRLSRQVPKDFLITPELFEELKRRFTPPNEAERPIAISGKHSFKMQYRSVLKRIASEIQPVTTIERSGGLSANNRTLSSDHSPAAKRRLRIFG